MVRFVSMYNYVKTIDVAINLSYMLNEFIFVVIRDKTNLKRFNRVKLFFLRAPNLILFCNILYNSENGMWVYKKEPFNRKALIIVFYYLVNICSTFYLKS